jgi:hypothetical protein
MLLFLHLCDCFLHRVHNILVTGHCYHPACSDWLALRVTLTDPRRKRINRTISSPFKACTAYLSALPTAQIRRYMPVASTDIIIREEWIENAAEGSGHGVMSSETLFPHLSRDIAETNEKSVSYGSQSAGRDLNRKQKAEVLSSRLGRFIMCDMVCKL